MHAVMTGNGAMLQPSFHSMEAVLQACRGAPQLTASNMYCSRWHRHKHHNVITLPVLGETSPRAGGVLPKQDACFMRWWDVSQCDGVHA